LRDLTLQLLVGIRELFRGMTEDRERLLQVFGLWLYSPYLILSMYGQIQFVTIRIGIEKD
jgi:hypothetical protein